MSSSTSSTSTCAELFQAFLQRGKGSFQFHFPTEYSNGAYRYTGEAFGYSNGSCKMELKNLTSLLDQHRDAKVKYVSFRDTLYDGNNEYDIEVGGRFDHV